jgi:hypothetical protein
VNGWSLPELTRWRVGLVSGPSGRGAAERPWSRGVVGIMRQGLTMLPAGFLLVLVLAGAGLESVPAEVKALDQRFGSRTAPILLLTRPDVQLDLNLDSRQIAAAKNEIARLLEQAWRLKNKTGPDIPAARQRIDNELVLWLTSNLSETQRERLMQISLQWEGAAAMTRPHIKTILNLTDPQLAAIDRLVAQLETARRTRGMLMPTEVGRFTAQAQSVLFPEQKEHWGSLLGPPCRFSIGGQTVMMRTPADPQVVKTRARLDH